MTSPDAPPIERLTARQQKAYAKAVAELDADDFEAWRGLCEAAFHASALRTLNHLSAQPLATLKFLGIRRAVEAGDVESFGRALRQYLRLQVVHLRQRSGLMPSGRFGWALQALATADREALHRVYPEDFAFDRSRKAKLAQAVTHLVLPWLWPDRFSAGAAMDEARAMLGTKNPVADVALVRALMASHDADPAAFSQQVSAFVAGYAKVNWIHGLYNAVGKYSAVHAYGVWALAELAHGPAFVDAATPPDTPIWDARFVARVRTGAPFPPALVFDGKLEGWNDPFQWNPKY